MQFCFSEPKKCFEKIFLKWGKRREIKRICFNWLRKRLIQFLLSFFLLAISNFFPLSFRNGFVPMLTYFFSEYIKRFFDQRMDSTRICRYDKSTINMVTMKLIQLGALVLVYWLRVLRDTRRLFMIWNQPMMPLSTKLF